MTYQQTKKLKYDKGSTFQVVSEVGPQFMGRGGATARGEFINPEAAVENALSRGQFAEVREWLPEGARGRTWRPGAGWA